MALIIPADNRILFFKRDRATFGFMSNFHPAPIIMDGEEWASVEYYYQTQKSPDPRYKAAIRAAVSPGMAKRLSAAPDAKMKIARNSWFFQNGEVPRADWMEVKLGILRAAVFAKFEQHPELMEMLLNTGAAEIVEDSKYDNFWGIGKNGMGPNWMGRILMEVRGAHRI